MFVSSAQPYNLSSATRIVSEDDHESFPLIYCQVLSPCPLATEIPPVFAAASFAEPLAIRIFLPTTCTLFPKVAIPDTSRVPFASIFPPNVLIPAVTFIPPFVTLNPCPAVIIPIESTFVT